MFSRAACVACIASAIGYSGIALAQDKPPDPPAAGETQLSTTGLQGAVGRPLEPLPPLVRFWRSNSGWTAHLSFADPVTEIQWSFSQDGTFQSTGSLPSYDQETRRQLANPSISVPESARVIFVRYADIQGNWAGPFALPFDPAVEIVRFYRSILETTTGSWLAFRRSAPNILYYTHIAGYRCAIREFRVGLDKDVPDRVVKLAPCDMRDPASNPADVDTHLWIDPAVNFASAKVVYKDGTESKVLIFQR